MNYFMTHVIEESTRVSVQSDPFPAGFVLHGGLVQEFDRISALACEKRLLRMASFVRDILQCSGKLEKNNLASKISQISWKAKEARVNTLICSKCTALGMLTN